MQCEVWSVKTLLRLSLRKKPLVEGRTRSGQVFLRTIGHLFLGNFRRRLARVYVTSPPATVAAKTATTASRGSNKKNQHQQQ